MLDAFIIEELRRREQAEKRKAERPHLELPLHNPADYAYSEPDTKPREEEDEDAPKKGDRGVIIIEY